MVGRCRWYQWIREFCQQVSFPFFYSTPPLSRPLTKNVTTQRVPLPKKSILIVMKFGAMIGHCINTKQQSANFALEDKTGEVHALLRTSVNGTQAPVVNTVEWFTSTLAVCAFLLVLPWWLRWRQGPSVNLGVWIVLVSRHHVCHDTLGQCWLSRPDSDFCWYTRGKWAVLTQRVQWSRAMTTVEGFVKPEMPCCCTVV